MIFPSGRNCAPKAAPFSHRGNRPGRTIRWRATISPAACGSKPVTASNSIAVPAKPTSIVSLSPTATETLFAIGAGREVKAVDSLSNYPSIAPKTDLSSFNLNIEAVAKYKPDLVVLSFDTTVL